MEDRIDELEDEVDGLQMELEDLQEKYDELEEKYNSLPNDIPSSLSELLNYNSRFDLGTVLELEEVIKEVLKKHGYKSTI